MSFGSKQFIFLVLGVLYNLAYDSVDKIVTCGRRYGESGIVTIHTYEHMDEKACASINWVIIRDSLLP